jgi:hypothetical protein
MKDILQPLFNQFIPFAQKRMGFNKPPRVFLRDDPQNAQNPLGKTAYYDPEQMSVTLYIHGRHPKDIMRSLSHELVHHTQNCNGQFNRDSEMGEGYAQRDPHLREMEREAYEQGNLCFRDWEDSIKNTIYIQNLNVNIQKEGKLNMSTKDWKNRELPTLLTEKWGFSFNMLTESQEEALEELSKGRYAVYDDVGGVVKVLDTEEKAIAALERYKRMDNSFQDFYVAEYTKEPARPKLGDEEFEFQEGEELDEAVEEGMCQQCAPNPCGCRPMEEGEDKKPDADGDGVPDYADKKPGEDDNKDKDEEEKSDKDLSKVPPQLRKHVKGKMDEAQIRNLIRKLVKEAMNKKENK